MKFLIILLFLISLMHYYHQSSMFENDRHFSHLSQLEREMTFRTEMGFYYNFYKRISIEFEDSLCSAFWSITNDNITEYPSTINGLSRFNIVPEVIIGVGFRVFNRMINYLGIELKHCWIVSRGDNLGNIESCEGLSDNFYFYLNFIFMLNSLVPVIIFIVGYLLSNYNILGGIISVISFAYNHGQATRVQWTPPLRESFAYPIYLMLHCYITYTIESRVRPKPVILIALVTVLILCWQFSQFILLTQLVSMYLTLKCLQLRHYNFDYFNTIIKYNFFAIVLASFFMFFNLMLITSLYSCFVIANLLFDTLLIKSNIIKCKSRYSFKHIFYQSFLIMCLTLILKLLLSIIFQNNDDSHIWLLLYSKFTNYKDFHTMLYTCAPEFDFISFHHIKSITLTMLLPFSFIATIIAFNINKISIQYHLIQTLFFMFMAFLIMRLKLLFIPQLCIITSILCYGWRFNIKKITIFALLISLMSFKGIINIKEQRNIIGEYFNQPLEQLINWVNSSTHQDSVFAGSMPTMANLMLSTRRAIVNHPHYESAIVRKRTYIIYEVYSSHDMLKWYEDISSLSIDYIIIEKNYCYFSSGKDDCRMSEIWKVEDFRLGRNNYTLDKPLICHQLFSQPNHLFKTVFANQHFTVLQLI